MKDKSTPWSWLIQETLPIDVSAGDLGIEIEAEFPGKIHTFAGTYWRSVEDGSLRNGIEYVLNNPIDMKSLDAALEELVKNTLRVKFRFGPRTSLHMHVNAQKLRVDELVSVCTAWWALENVFTRTQGPLREGNLFALRGKDAESIVINFARDLANGFGFTSTGRPQLHTPNELRYAALNLSALRKFGSVEFRFMRGTVDTREIRFWAETLYTFVHEAKKLSVDRIVDGVLGSTSDKALLLNTLFGDGRTEALLARVGPDWDRLIEENVHYPLLIQKSFHEALSVCQEKPITRYLKLPSSDDLPDEYATEMGKKKPVYQTQYSRPEDAEGNDDDFFERPPEPITAQEILAREARGDVVQGGMIPIPQFRGRQAQMAWIDDAMLTPVAPAPRRR